MNIIRTILTGTWAIEPNYAQKLLPLARQVVSGNYNAASALAVRSEMELIGSGNQYSVVIPIHGTIMKYDFCGDMGMLSLVEWLQRLDMSPDVISVVLDVDSGGGEASYMPNVVEAIQKFSKPIYCHFSGMCCSAAYWLACACDGIYASQATDITGSIGALIQIVYDNPEFTHEFSVKTVYATKSTEKNKEFNDAIAGDDKRLKKIWLDPITNKFISDVTANRKDVSDKAFTGTTMTANDALSMNLIDGIQSLDETILQSRS